MALADERERNGQGLLTIGELEHDLLVVRIAQGASEPLPAVDRLAGLDGDPAADAALKMLRPDERPGDARRRHLELEPLGVAAQDIGDATTDLVVDALWMIDRHAQHATGDLHVEHLDIGELGHDVTLDLARDGRPHIGPRHCCSFLSGECETVFGYPPNEKAGLKPALL